MCIFEGVCWRGVSDEWDHRKCDYRFFRLLYLPNFHIQGRSCDTVMCSRLVALFIDTEIGDLEWLVCIKVCLGIGLCFLDFRQNVFGNLQSYTYTVSSKNVANRL